ncbi:MAG: SPOR domain-containing protein [Ignavibacteria bacterium]|nr:SPOR domain-containing protein [Ignavibacteria bacterium]
MKKFTQFLLTITILILTFVIYSCSSTKVLEDCDCDDYTDIDTMKVSIVDTVRGTETVFVDKDNKFYVQIGCFANKNYAERFADEAKNKLESTILVILSKDNLYRVMAGEYIEITDAKNMLSSVKIKGYTDAFIRDKYGPVEK